MHFEKGMHNILKKLKNICVPTLTKISDPLPETHLFFIWPKDEIFQYPPLQEVKIMWAAIAKYNQFQKLMD